ncbi:phosphate butyryltransferase [Inediibacterium massiliense]|uniref:phosphate butyryltransferase n=1 Tax=Inediibacterium massiliense TaxID=1658111 RepID=UPI0006B48FB5|nr:phosphate butyryltransferase [Inediibacterium massiliense]
MKKMDELVMLASKKETKTIAIAVAQDQDVLKAVDEARRLGLVKAILVGDEKEIKKVCKEEQIDVQQYEIIHEEDPQKSCLKAVELVSTKKAHMAMKGLVDTSIILRAVLNKEVGLRSGKVLSHVAVFEIPKFDRLFFITDAAMNILPDIKTKKEIIENVVEVAHSLDIKKPKVAILCAKEKVDKNMQATIDAKELENMNQAGEIKGCIVGGPFALDNAVSKEAAKHKGINHPVAGNAEILVVSNIEAGNVLYKSLVFFSEAKNAGVIVGAKAPIILTSRADSPQSKLNSIALGVLMADFKEQ